MSMIKSVDELGELEEQELEELYTWIDSIPLSRPKRNIARDFSDGVLVAEVIKHECPKLVDVHNYTAASSTQQKMQNWFLLNRKVFKKLRFELGEDVIRQISNAHHGVIERVLQILRVRLERVAWETKQQAQRQAELDQRPEADQNHYQKDDPNKVDGLEDAKKESKQKRKKQSKEEKRETTKDDGEAPEDMSPRRNPSKEKVGAPANTGPYRGMNPGSFKSKTDDMVPLILLEEKAQEVLAKDETIQILQAKIKRLEHLLHLKDIRIEDLQTRLEATRPTGKR